MRINAVPDLAVYARIRRQALAMTQADLAAAASVSRRWLSAFEAGKPTVEVGLVLRTLDALGLGLDLRPADQLIDEDNVDLDAVLGALRLDRDHSGDSGD